MAKNRKNNLFEDAVEVKQSSTLESNENEFKQSDVKDEIAESTSEIDKDKRISELLEQVNDFEAKIAEYILELEPLRESNSKLIFEKKRLEDLLNSRNNEFLKLQEENDQYLVKIADLTFELTKANSKTPNTISQMHQPIVANNFKPISKHVNYNHSNNGYGSWN